MNLRAGILILSLPAIASAAPPFRAAEGLFDLSNSKSSGLTAIAGEHKEIHHATEESGFRFAHHPGLIVFKDRLYCSWSNGRAHEDWPDQRVLYSSSSDGKTWSASRILAQPAEGVYGSCVAAGVHVHDDTLVGYFTLTHEYPTHNLHNEKNAVWAITSRDGANWSQPTMVAAGFYIEAPRLLSNGRLFLGGEHTGEIWKSYQARMRLLYSDSANGTDGWKQAAIDPTAAEPNGLKLFGYTEPCPFIRKDGTVVCPFRNQSGFLYASVSRDNGKTWSVPEQTNFPDSMARFNTGRLPDGRIYVINNPGPGRMNRSLLTIALSGDGIVFDRAWIIRGEPTTQRFKGKGKRDGWQYPSSLVWKDSLFVAYSVNKEDVTIARIALDSFDEPKKK
ncbi:MAG: exo-alpha-sialidase [Planctomycetes bacterium]|nr:exo-alpha-sialidase [Planctomycetota bacterium]MBL7044883.1 exo-alpha-sialidase [Pirellulaceae bacterium]